MERAHRDSNAEDEELNRVNQSRQKKRKKSHARTGYVKWTPCIHTNILSDSSLPGAKR